MPFPGEFGTILSDFPLNLEHPFASMLQGAWIINPASVAGNIVRDLTPGNHFATGTGPLVVPGPFPDVTALQYNANPQTVTNSAYYNITNDFSISAWFNTTTAADATLVGKNPHSGNARYGFALNDTAAHINVLLVTPSGTVVNLNTNAITLNDGNWHHITVGFGVSRGLLHFLIDGHFYLKTTFTADSTTGTNANNFQLGGDGFSSNKYIGSLSSVFYWRRFFTEVEMVRFYESAVRGHPQFFNRGPSSLYYWRYTESQTASGGLSLGGRASASLRLNDIASGGLSLGGSALTAFKLRDVASGGLSLSGSASVVPNYNYIASGGLSLGGSALPIPRYRSYVASGGLGLGGKASVQTTVNISKEFTWDIGQGILRNWRIEGKCEPVTTGDDTDCPPGTASMQFMINLAAHSLTELCQKLTARGLVFPIKKIQLWSQPTNKSDWTSDVDPNHNTLTTVDFSSVPDCMPLQVDGSLSVTGVASSALIFTASYSYVASGSLSSSSQQKVQSSHYSYVASGGLGLGGSSRASSPQFFIYIASGGLNLGQSANYYNNNYGIISSSGKSSSVITNLGINFGAIPANALVASTSLVAVSCCSSYDLPQLIFINQDLSRSDALANFLYLNQLTFNPIQSLRYSAARNSWYTNVQFGGMSPDQTGQQTWNIILEFGCLSENGLLNIPTNAWGFSLIVTRKSGSRVDVTRLLLEFDPSQICTGSGALNFDFTFNVNSLTTLSTPSRTVAFSDSLNFFNGSSYQDDPNVAFEVSVSPPDVGVGLFDQSKPLQDILLG